MLMDSAAARERMIREQLLARHFNDKSVLEAMRRVPRERFIPGPEQAEAYADSPQPIGCRQTISQPFMVAVMAGLLELRPWMRVLDVGTGSGYAAAVMSQLCAEVYSIERIAELASSARERLSKLGYSNVQVQHGDGFAGWPAHAPYDGICVAAAALETPPALLEQLAPGGRMVIPIGRQGGEQRLWLYTRLPEGIKAEDCGYVQFIPLLPGVVDSGPGEASD